MESDEEYKVPDIQSYYADEQSYNNEGRMDKVKFENSITSYNVSIRGRNIAIMIQPTTTDSDDHTQAFDEGAMDVDEREELESLFKIKNDNITDFKSGIMNISLEENGNMTSRTLTHHSATLSHEYLILILVLLLFVILLPPRFPQCSQTRRIVPYTRTSPLHSKVPDKTQASSGINIKKAIVGKYLLIASTIGNISANIESPKNSIEEEITEINI